MIKLIYNEAGTKLLSTVEAEPVCGEDFCDSCGDCLACYDEDECTGSEDGHTWIQYGSDSHSLTTLGG